MGSRRNVPPSYHVLLEDKYVSQEAEIESLSRDNRTLASGHLTLRQDLVAAKREADKLRDHIGSIQNAGDIEIRMLLDKIAKSEADIRAAENIKKEVQGAHAEARKLLTERMELTDKIQRATTELDKCHANDDKIEEKHAKLDGLKQEHERLRETFEYEKGLNVKKVKEMKILEKDLIGMVEEVERLRAEVLSADKRASASTIRQSVPHIMSNNISYPPLFHENGDYLDSCSVPHLQTIHGAVVDETNPYAGGSLPQM